MQIKFLSRISEFTKSTSEFLHLAYSIAPIAIVVINYFWAIEKLQLEIYFLLTAAFINFLILWSEADAEDRVNNELSLLYTFFRDKLKPLKGVDKPVSREKTATKIEEETLNIQVSIVEAQNKDDLYYKNKLYEKFQTDPVGEVQREDQKIGGLKMESILCGPRTNIKGSEIAKSEKQLYRLLTDSKAIVVIRTKDTDRDRNNWIYKTVEEWAHEHSEVPILFVNKEVGLAEEGIVANFRQIPNDSKSLPWFLLERANHRGKTWRTQATFNRAIVWSIFYLILMMIYTGWIMDKHNNDAINELAENQHRELLQMTSEVDFQKKKADVQILMDGFHHISETKKEIRNRIILHAINEGSTLSTAPGSSVKASDLVPQIAADASIDVEISYWFTYNKNPHIFITTELQGTTDNFPKNKASLIGCGFVHPNRIIEWSVSNGKMANVWKFDGNPDSDLKCDMTELPNSPIDHITCATYSDTHYPDEIIGICMFTKKNYGYIYDQVKLLFAVDTRTFLYERCKDYFDRFKDAIVNRRLVPLSHRRVWTPTNAN